MRINAAGGCSGGEGGMRSTDVVEDGRLPLPLSTDTLDPSDVVEDGRLLPEGTEDCGALEPPLLLM